MIKYHPHFILILLMAVSCTTQKQITYMQGIDDEGTEKFFPFSKPQYEIQEQDVLYVSIITLDEDVNKMLNPGGSIGLQNIVQSRGGAYLTGYALNDSGCIRLPLLGDIPVLHKTVEEASSLIEEKASLMLKNPNIIVKLLTFNITILGEVKGPGTYQVFSNQFTILEALGMAGDLTDFGDRSRVLVIRPDNTGSKVFRIDLKDKNLLSSEAYFLLPNDVVIVEPRKVKLLSLNAQTFSLFLSTIISIISLTILVQNIN